MSNLKDPAVLFYIDTWLSATAEMDSDVRGWYLNLILHNYDKKSLPNDIEKLALLAGVKFSEFERFKQMFEQVLKQKFKQNDEGRLENDYTKNILQAREQFKDKRAKSGTIGYIVKLANTIKGIKDKQITSLKEHLYTLEIEEIEKYKDKQMLEQMLEQMLKLYINKNKDENKDNNINNDINDNIIFETNISELKNESEIIVKKFHSLYESDYKVWLNAKFGKWIEDYEKLKKEFGETYINKFSAIYTELAMQKMQFYKCSDFEFKTYKSLGGLLKKEKNDIYVYEKLLEIGKDRYSSNQKWIDEYNANLEMFKQIKENGK